MFDLALARTRFSIPGPLSTQPCRGFLRAIMVFLITTPTPAPSDPNVVHIPQLTLTDLRPQVAVFHPRDNSRILVVNDVGRIDVFNIGDWANPTKEVEIWAGARAAAFSPNGELIVSGSADGTVRLWNAGNGAPQAILGLHDGAVMTVSFSPNGKYVASRARDHTVTLWDTKALKKVGDTMNGEQNVAGVLFGVDGARIVYKEGGVTTYTPNHVSSNAIESEDDHDVRWGLAYSRDVAVSYGGRRVVSTTNGDMTLFDSDDGTTRRVPIGPEYDMKRVAFHPDAEIFVLGDSEGRLHLWNAANPKEIGEPFAGHNGSISSVAFSPDGTRIISAGSDNALRLWHVESGSPIGEPWHHQETVARLAFSPDGTRIASAAYAYDRNEHRDVNHEVAVWDANTGLPIHVSPLRNEVRVESIVFSPDGRFIVSSDVEGTVQYWDVVANESTFAKMEKQEASYSQISFKQDGKLVGIVVGEDATQLWDVKTSTVIGGRLRVGSQSVSSVALSDDAELVAIGRAEDFGIELWNVRDSSIAATLTGNENDVLSLAFSPNGQQLVSGSSDGTLRLWNDMRGNWEQELLGKHEGWVLAVAFSPDGKRIVSGDSSGQLRLWDANSGAAVGEPLDAHQDGIRTVVFSPDSTRVVSADESGAIRRWGIVHGLPIGDALYGRNPSVLSTTFSSDGMRIASTGYDRVLRWWNLESGGEPKILSHHTYLTVVTSGVNGSVAASSDGETLRMWDMNSGRAIGEPRVGVSAVAFSDDQKTIVVGDYDGVVSIWDLSSGRVTALEPPHGGAVERVAVSKDNRLVASDDDSDTGSLRLWEVPSGLYDDLPIDGSRRDDLRFTASGKLMALHERLGDYALQEYDTRQHAFGGGREQAITERKLIAISGRQPQFGPNGSRIMAYLSDGGLTLVDLEGRELSRTLVCLDAYGLARVYPRWVNHDIIAVSCSDRTVFFDSRLDRRGEILLLDGGVVAIVDGRGVYASPRRLMTGVLAYSGNTAGLAEAVPMRVVRERLFDQWTIWSQIGRGVTTASIWVERVYQSLGKWTIPFWVLIAMLCLMTIWLFFPVQLAWLSIVGGSEWSRSRTLEVTKNVLDVITLFVWLGRTKRPLIKWLQKYREALERTCFTERDQVSRRERFVPVGDANLTARFVRQIAGSGRGLVWVEGTGGSGKSAFAMHLLRSAMIGKHGPVPVLVDEDWEGSLAEKVACQLRLRDWTKGPTEITVKRLGAMGLICPLVDSLSERGMTDAEELVENAVSEFHFRHLVVTSRRSVPSGYTWEDVARVRTRPVRDGDLPAFVRVYVGDCRAAEIEGRIRAILDGKEMPSPLFLRFATELAACGKLGALGRTPLVLKYVEALRADIQESDMKRVAAIAGMVSLQDRLIPQEFSEQQLLSAIVMACHDRPFYDRIGSNEVSAPRLVEMLVNCGLIRRGMMRMQFNYDPVAEYLVAWWVIESEERGLDSLRKRIRRGRGTGVARAYEDVRATLSAQ